MNTSSVLLWLVICVSALVVGVTVELLTRERKSRRAAISRAVVSMVVAPVVFYGIKTWIEAPQRRAQAVREEKTQELLDDLVARLGNREAAEELIKLKSEALFASSSGDAEKFAKSLLEELPQKAQNYKALQDSSKQLADRLRLDWEPVCHLVLQAFDERVAALTRRGVELKMESKSFIVVEPTKTPRPLQLVRDVQVAGGYRLNVYVRSGEVDLGKLASNSIVYISGSGKEGGPEAFLTSLY